MFEVHGSSRAEDYPVYHPEKYHRAGSRSLSHWKNDHNYPPKCTQKWLRERKRRTISGLLRFLMLLQLNICGTSWETLKPKRSEKAPIKPKRTAAIHSQKNGNGVKCVDREREALWEKEIYWERQSDPNRHNCCLNCVSNWTLQSAHPHAEHCVHSILNGDFQLSIVVANRTLHSPEITLAIGDDNKSFAKISAACFAHLTRERTFTLCYTRPLCYATLEISTGNTSSFLLLSFSQVWKYAGGHLLSTSCLFQPSWQSLRARSVHYFTLNFFFF